MVYPVFYLRKPPKLLQLFLKVTCIKSKCTWNFQRSTISLFLSKHVSCSSSSKPHLMAPNPLGPAPAPAVRLLAIEPQLSGRNWELLLPSIPFKQKLPCWKDLQFALLHFDYSYQQWESQYVDHLLRAMIGIKDTKIHKSGLFSHQKFSV